MIISKINEFILNHLGVAIGRNCMVIGYTYVISTSTGNVLWFLATNKTDHHIRTQLLLKVVFTEMKVLTVKKKGDTSYTVPFNFHFLAVLTKIVLFPNILQ